MKKAYTIRHFFFNFAEYRVSGGSSDEVLLRVYYKDNRYEIVSVKGQENRAFRKELSAFAEDLLRRKHNMDFAEK